MAIHKIRKGLTLPILGEPDQTVEETKTPRRVAIVAADAIGLRPTMRVDMGDSVKLGQVLFEDKKSPGVLYTSPGSGKVVGINRGERRALQSVVVQLSGSDEASFSSFAGKHPNELRADDVRALLLESGLWTALRERPFGHVAHPEARSHSIFVTAMDTSPLAPDVERILQGAHGDFERGLATLLKLTEGPVYVCTAPASSVPVPSDDRLRREEFEGPHPAGTVGLHIHWLDPVDRNKVVWHIGYQDVVAIGKLFETGRLDPTRVVSLAGPSVRNPRLVRTRIGASLDEMTEGELREGPHRVVSGSVLSGRKAAGEVHGYLGRYHCQVSVLPEGRERDFLGWLGPGLDQFSVTTTFLSKLIPGKKFAMNTAKNGSLRAIIPIGVYEKVMPMDIEPTFLLRSLLMKDVERAEELGCLELEEEDLALCTYVDPGKNDYGPYLREVLTTLEKEG
jgi:Na+-transporting NADH:ubiquinone oxidoreductase subunit A